MKIRGFLFIFLHECFDIIWTCSIDTEPWLSGSSAGSLIRYLSFISFKYLFYNQYHRYTILSHRPPFIVRFSFLGYTKKLVNTTEGRTCLNVGWALLWRKLNFDTFPLTYWREEAAAAAMRHTVLCIARLTIVSWC